MSALDGPRDPRDNSPLFGAFCTAFVLIEFFGYQGFPWVGFLIMTVVMSAAMLIIGICLLVVDDAGSTGITDKPDAPIVAADPVDGALLDNPVVLKVPNPERILDEPLGEFLHGLAYEVSKPRTAADRQLAKAVREFNENVISR